MKVLRHWPLGGDFIGDLWIPAQMASNAENVSIWWRHYGNQYHTSIVYLLFTTPSAIYLVVSPPINARWPCLPFCWSETATVGPDAFCSSLTHWGRVTHIRVVNLTIIGSDNGLSPGQRQAITWTNVGILLIGPLGTNFSEILIEIHTFSFKKIHLKMSSGKWRPFCLGLNVLSWCHDNIT